MPIIKPKIAILLLSLIIIIAATAYVSVNIFLVRGPICGTDLLQVGYDTTYNPQDNTLLLEVKSSKNQAYTLNQVIVKDYGGQVLVNKAIEPTELPVYGARNITVDLGGYAFASGEGYTVELGTAEGTHFDSVFFLYEYVKTEVPAFTSNTISVYVQSHANQTLIFNKATIFKAPDKDQKSPNYPTEVTLSPQIELLPNYNVTITIPYVKGLSAGNYTVYLHSSPKFVIGAMPSFAVTGLEDSLNQT